MTNENEEELTYEQKVAHAEAEDIKRQLAALGKNGGSQSMKDLKADFDAKAEKEESSRKLIGVISIIFMAVTLVAIGAIYFLFKDKI